MSARIRVPIAIAVMTGCVLCGFSRAVRAEESPKTRTVKAGEIKLKVPESWKQQPPTNKLRLAQFTVPKAPGDAEDGEFVVFFFGGATGGTDANVQRWINQFDSKDRNVKLTKGKSPLGEYVLVDLRGTYKKPVGPPIQQRTVPMPNARVINMILSVKDQGNYFLRLTGTEKTTSANVESFRKAIDADPKSETEHQPSAE